MMLVMIKNDNINRAHAYLREPLAKAAPMVLGDAQLLNGNYEADHTQRTVCDLLTLFAYLK